MRGAPAGDTTDPLPRSRGESCEDNLVRWLKSHTGRSRSPFSSKSRGGRSKLGTKLGSSPRISWDRLCHVSKQASRCGPPPWMCLSGSCHSLGFSSVGVNPVRCRPLKRTIKGTHVGPHLLDIFQEVVVLLEVHARHAVEEVALQSQGNGSPGRPLDCVACLRDVDAVYSLTIHLSASRIDA